MLLNGTGGRQLATRMALNCTANDCRSPDVVPATPSADVRLGAPGVEPEIAAGQAGSAGGAGGAGAGAGAGAADEPEPEPLEPDELEPEEPLAEEPLDPDEVDDPVPPGREEVEPLEPAADCASPVGFAEPSGACDECSSSGALSRPLAATRRSTNSTSETVESSAPRLPSATMTGDELPVAVAATASPSVPGPPKNGRQTTMTAVNAPPANAERIICVSPYCDPRSPPTATHHDRCGVGESQL